MKKPLVSIVMSEFNTRVEQFDLSLKSIISQDYENFEIIIVDDCGNNNVEKLISKYGDKRIKVVKNEVNLGLAQSLNNGIKNSNGKYIIRMDTDDIMLPKRISVQVAFAEEHPEYSIIGGNYILFDDKNEYGCSHFDGEVNEKDFLKGPPFAHPTILLRKDDIIKTGLYPDYRRCQDYAMEMQMYSLGYKGYNLPYNLIKYRQDSDGYKKKKFKNRVLEYKIRKKYFKKLSLPFYNGLYVIKPLIVGLIPVKVLKIYHENKINKNK